MLCVGYDGCETWPITLKEEHRLRVIENRLLRRIFGYKGEEVVGGWRRLHNEELYNFYASPNVIRVIKWRRMGWAGHVACMGEMRNGYRIFVGKPEGGEKKHAVDVGVSRKISLGWILEK
jgi:hypothetical protein